MEFQNGNYVEAQLSGNDSYNLEKTQAACCEISAIHDESSATKLNMKNDQNLISKDLETTSLLSAFRKLHEKRMISAQTLGCINEDEKNKEMLHILRQYVDQLEEQNDVLMTTMMELETEAQQRVVQMEKRLKSSAKSTMEAVINLNECDKEMRRLITQRLQMESALDDMQHQVTSLKIENNFLRDQNFNLNHDIQALLHIIQHARTTGHWEMDCVTFCEVTPEQVFGPVQSLSQLYPESVEYSPESLEIDMNVQKSSERILQSCEDPSSNVTEMNDGINNMHWSAEEICNELLEKERSKCTFQSKVMHVEHEQFILKGEDECCSQELLSTKQQNQYSFCKENESPVIVERISKNHPDGHVLTQKCLSLPNIDDFMHPSNYTQKSSFYADFILCQKKHSSMMEIQYLGQMQRKRTKIEENEGKWPCKPVQQKFDHGQNFRQMYSEPLLFIYGNSVCVYRPCEPLDKELIILTDDFHHDILPCQSIDLKIPTEENDLIAREWDHQRNPQDFPVFDGSPCMPCQRVTSKNSCTSSDSDETYCSKKMSFKAEVINLDQEEFPPVVHSHDFSTRLSHLCEKSNSFNQQQLPCKSYISCSVQTSDNLCSFSVSTQADLNEGDTHGMKHSLIENGYLITDVEEINHTVQKMKKILLKAEDKVAAKEILIEQLQNHLQGAMKQVEMKDTAIENIERKLGISRIENTSLKCQISDLQSEVGKLLQGLEDAKVIQDNLQLNVEARKEQIEELREQEQMLQNQKRSLMIQLDTQGDELANARSDLLMLKEDIKSYKLKVEQQTIIIKTLQDAVVQSKRALDVVRQTPHPKAQVRSNNSLVQKETVHSSRSSVVDI